MFKSKHRFDVSKTKVNLKMLTNRFQLLTQKKANLAKQQKRQVATLLRDDKEQNARILVEHIIREARCPTPALPISTAPSRMRVWRRAVHEVRLAAGLHEQLAEFAPNWTMIRTIPSSRTRCCGNTRRCCWRAWPSSPQRMSSSPR